MNWFGKMLSNKKSEKKSPTVSSYRFYVTKDNRIIKAHKDGANYIIRTKTPKGIKSVIVKNTFNSEDSARKYIQKMKKK